MVIIGIGRQVDNGENFLHRYDNFVGWVQCGFNIGLYIYFMFGISETKGQDKSSKVQNFLNQLTIFGTIFFFTFPFLMVLSVAVLPYNWRAEVIELGRIISQSLAQVLMTFACTNQKSGYMSVQNLSMQLPMDKFD